MRWHIRPAPGRMARNIAESTRRAAAYARHAVTAALLRGRPPGPDALRRPSRCRLRRRWFRCVAGLGHGATWRKGSPGDRWLAGHWPRDRGATGLGGGPGGAELRG